MLDGGFEKEGEDGLGFGFEFGEDESFEAVAGDEVAVVAEPGDDEGEKAGVVGEPTSGGEEEAFEVEVFV